MSQSEIRRKPIAGRSNEVVAVSPVTPPPQTTRNFSKRLDPFQYNITSPPAPEGALKVPPEFFSLYPAPYNRPKKARPKKIYGHALEGQEGDSEGHSSYLTPRPSQATFSGTSGGSGGSGDETTKESSVTGFSSVELTSPDTYYSTSSKPPLMELKSSKPHQPQNSSRSARSPPRKPSVSFLPSTYSPGMDSPSHAHHPYAHLEAEHGEPSTVAVKAKPKAWYKWGPVKSPEEPEQANVRAEKRSQFSGKGIFRPRKTSMDDEEASKSSTGFDRPLLEAGSPAMTSNDHIKTYNNPGKASSEPSKVTTTHTPRLRQQTIQAADYILEKYAQHNGDWNRVPVSRSTPYILRLSEWALKPLSSIPAHERQWDAVGRHKLEWLWVAGSYVISTIIVSVPLQILLALPFAATWGEDYGAEDGNLYFGGSGGEREWPKYASNSLDLGPAVQGQMEHTEEKERGVDGGGKRVSGLERPRKLMVRRGEMWELEESPKRNLPYVFISYVEEHFQPRTSSEGRNMLEWMAIKATLDAGYTAFWLDYRCRPGQDASGNCSIISDSARVVAILPDDNLQHKQQWGRRLWTLPECLLAPGNTHFCHPNERGTWCEVVTFGKVEMSAQSWMGEDGETDESVLARRRLAQHFEGVRPLSRSALMQNSILALSRYSNPSTPSSTSAKPDLLYVLLGLLDHSLHKDKSATIFQSLARLSLIPSNDAILERLLCLHPVSSPSLSSSSSIFSALARPDTYNTHLWDITPLCTIAGVPSSSTAILLDSPRFLPITWTSIPSLHSPRPHAHLPRALLATTTFCFLSALFLAAIYTPFFASNFTAQKLGFKIETLTVILALLAIGGVFALFTPLAVRDLYAATRPSNQLVGFEGVMGLEEVERAVFGELPRVGERLRYSRSSMAVETSEAGIERAEKGLQEGRRLFTVVDLAGGEVSVFAAARPPAVGLVCGWEGGRCRVVLCSEEGVDGERGWRKETVLRMGSHVRDAGRARGWARVRLAE